MVSRLVPPNHTFAGLWTAVIAFMIVLYSDN